MNENSTENTENKINKKPLQIRDVVIAVCLPVFLLFLYFIFSYILPYTNSQDSAEIRRIIYAFPDTLKEPVEIPEKENGRYWYSLAGLDDKRTDKKYENLKTFVESNMSQKLNNDKITFKSINIAPVLKEYASELEYLKKGSACKYFVPEFEGKGTSFEYIRLYKDSNFRLARHYQQLYRFKALCEINNKEYDKAAGTINDSFMFAVSLHRNNVQSDRKNLISSMVEVGLNSIACESLEYLLEKSDKPYPQLLQTLKHVKSEFSDQEIEKVFENERDYMLLMTDAGGKSESEKEFKKGKYVYVLFSQLGTTPQAPQVMSLFCEVMKHNFFENHKFVVNYMATKELKIFDEMSKYNNNPLSRLTHFSEIAANYPKAVQQLETAQRKVNSLESMLEKRK